MALLKGRGEIERFFAGLFGAGVSGHRLVLLEANGEGNTAVAAARWSAKGKDGASLHEFAKQADDGLELRRHTFN